jgi:hypothetical protein
VDRPTTSRSVGRAVRFTEIGGLAALQLLLWLSYRHRRVRWRVQGAVTNWENDLKRGGSRRAGRRQTMAGGH